MQIKRKDLLQIEHQLQIIVFMWGNLVTWSSKKQGVVARCSAEAKFSTIDQEICESLWIPSSSQRAKGDSGSSIEVIL